MTKRKTLVPKNIQFNKNKRWDKEDKEYLLKNENKSLTQLAKDLGRSYNSVALMKHKLLKKDYLPTKKVKNKLILSDYYYIAEWYGKIAIADLKAGLHGHTTNQEIEEIYNILVEDNLLDEYKSKYWEME